MGLRAGYQYLNDENLTKLKACSGDEEVFDYLEAICADSDDDFADMLDIDKMWDALHFVLTGVSACEPIDNDPLSEAVVGVRSLEDIEDFIAYTEKTRVAEILSALEAFDIDGAMEKFSMEACKKAELYPNIWDYDDEEEELKEEISDYFQNLKDFYREVLAKNGNVMATIY